MFFQTAAQENQRQQKEKEGEVWQIVPTQINIGLYIYWIKYFFCDHKARSWDGPGVGCQLFQNIFCWIQTRTMILYFLDLQICLDQREYCIFVCTPHHHLRFTKRLCKDTIPASVSSVQLCSLPIESECKSFPCPQFPLFFSAQRGVGINCKI